MKRIILLSMLFFSFNLFGQVFESIEKEAANVFLLNINNSSKEQAPRGQSELLAGLEKLKANLFNDNNNSKDIEELRNHFAQFVLVSKNISVDSALFLFNQWYLQLSNTFYDYCKEKFFSSPKIKIILFSASMSCYCTLEMCKNQTIDILNFVKGNNGEYDYWIIDSYEHNELQIKYGTNFVPSVLVLNKNNEMLYKIEYEEKMIDKLENFLKG